MTLPEILVALLITGNLASIAIPTFLGFRQSAKNEVARSSVERARVTVESYFAKNETFTGLTAAALTEIEPSVTWAIAANNGSATTPGPSQNPTRVQVNFFGSAASLCAASQGDRSYCAQVNQNSTGIVVRFGKAQGTIGAAYAALGTGW